MALKSARCARTVPTSALAPRTLQLLRLDRPRSKNAIFTNVAIDGDGNPWWEGLTSEPPKDLTSWRESRHAHVAAVSIPIAAHAASLPAQCASRGTPAAARMRRTPTAASPPPPPSARPSMPRGRIPLVRLPIPSLLRPPRRCDAPSHARTFLATPRRRAHLRHHLRRPTLRHHPPRLPVPGLEPRRLLRRHDDVRDDCGGRGRARHPAWGPLRHEALLRLQCVPRDCAHSPAAAAATAATHRASALRPHRLTPIADMGDYFQHWLTMGERAAPATQPKIFYVNWCVRAHSRRAARNVFLAPRLVGRSQVPQGRPRQVHVARLRRQLACAGVDVQPL